MATRTTLDKGRGKGDRTRISRGGIPGQGRVWWQKPLLTHVSATSAGKMLIYVKAYALIISARLLAQFNIFFVMFAVAGVEEAGRSPIILAWEEADWSPCKLS